MSIRRPSKATCSGVRSRRWQCRRAAWCVRPAGSAARPWSMFRPTPIPWRSASLLPATPPAGSATSRSAPSPVRSRAGPRLRERPRPTTCRYPRCFGAEHENRGERTMLNRRRILLGGTAVAAAAAFCIPSALRAEPGELNPEVIAWLKANALPLTTAEPGSGVKDLEQLRPLIGDARVVSLGEATHGTREFFQLKHRVMEYCISQLGFTVIAFEAYFGATLAVNDYVLRGNGNARDAASSMGMGFWDTEEVAALIEWVRGWNLTHERKVKFYGFDMQSA